jgi:hypothetical protein
MVLRSNTLGLIILVFIIGGMAAGKSLGLFEDNSPRSLLEQQIDGEEGVVAAVDIRGSYTFSDISRAFQIPIEILKDAFHLPEEVNFENFRCGDLESIYGDLDNVEIGTGSVKLFVALYTGEEYDIVQEDFLLSDAMEILKGRGQLTDEQRAYLESHTIDSSTLSLPANTGSDPILGEDHEEQMVYMIQGKTTFADIYNWGVSKGVVEEIIGQENPTGSILDFCAAQGLSFSEIKSKLQIEVDKVSP